MRGQMFRLRTQMMLEGDNGDDDGVLIDGHTGSMCACNGSAVAMLELLKGAASEAGLATELTHRFAVSAARAGEDARGFLQSLSAMGAIETMDAEALPSPRPSGDSEVQPA